MAAKEMIMHYIWHHRLWPVTGIVTATDGRKVRVIDHGELNYGSGPDFFNAKIEVDGEVWAGNVEMHVSAADWHRHGHDGDPAYANVILHVVQRDDTVICPRGDGVPVLQVVMDGLDDFCARHDSLVTAAADGDSLPCASILPQMPPILIGDWLTALCYERLQGRADKIMDMVSDSRGDWEAAAFVLLARGLGFGTNADAMERLARSLPVNILLKYSDNPVAVEALLLGRAGMISDRTRDDYEALLLREYNFYRVKHDLDDLPTPLVWSTRRRPVNQPVRRIALLASLLCHGAQFGSRLLDAVSNLNDDTAADSYADYAGVSGDAFGVVATEPEPVISDVRRAKVAIDNLRAIFDVNLSSYWNEYQTFGKPLNITVRPVSQSTLQLLIINVAVPYIYAHSLAVGDRDTCDVAVAILESLQAESNAPIRPFITAGIKCEDAFASQALLQLRKCYCAERKCLYCRFGYRMLTRSPLAANNP